MLKQLETTLGTGYAAAGCRGCGKVFTSVTAFDKHQRFTREGLVCLDPASVGLERKSSGRWGQKATDAQKARVAHFNDAARISGTFNAPLVSPVGSTC